MNWSCFFVVFFNNNENVVKQYEGSYFMESLPWFFFLSDDVLLFFCVGFWPGASRSIKPKCLFSGDLSDEVTPLLCTVLVSPLVLPLWINANTAAYV